MEPTVELKIITKAEEDVNADVIQMVNRHHAAYNRQADLQRKRAEKEANALAEQRSRYWKRKLEAVIEIVISVALVALTIAAISCMFIMWG